MTGLLSGVRAVSLAQQHPGRYSTTLLADLVRPDLARPDRAGLTGPQRRERGKSCGD
jgi:hypothetical protein